MILLVLVNLKKNNDIIDKENQGLKVAALTNYCW